MPADTAPTASSDLKKGPSALGVPGALYVDAQGNVVYQGYTAQRYEDVPGLVGGGWEYVSGDQMGTQLQDVRPKYFDGDQYLPASKLSTDEMIELQAQLEAGDFYEGDHIMGVWGEADSNAYTLALKAANRAGTTVDEIIARAGAAPKKAKARAPLIVKLTNPDDLKAIAKKVSQDTYGGNLPDADLERFVSAYQQMESGYQTAAYNMGDPSATGTLGGGGGTITTPPNASVAIENQIRAEHPDQVAATAFGKAMDTIIGTFTGSRAGG